MLNEVWEISLIEENTRDAYRLMVEGEISHRTMAQTKEIGIEFAN